MTCRCDPTLNEWAKQWKTENLDEEMRRLIRQADFDLWYGPIRDGGDPDCDEYPGFTEACDRIKDALRDLPRELYIDADFGDWSESEPEPERCEACDGQGKVTDGDERKCEECSGCGCFEASGDWWRIEYREVVEVIVGQELGEYVT